MCDHSHSGNCCHNEPEDLASLFSLYQHIDLINLECLNESVAGSGKRVFKPYEERKEFTVYVESDADEELLFNIPFTGNIKLKGMIMAGDNSNEHPNTVAIYKNRPFMSFSDLDVVELSIDPNGDIVYPLKVTRFTSVNSLTIHVRSNFGGDTTRIHYIGLRGDFTPAPRREVVIATYELAPNFSDHKSESIISQTHFIE